jgi:hypothetical protein
METDQDLRTEALLAQLEEIDQQILEVTRHPLNRTQRVLRLALFGIILVLLALFSSTLERMGIGVALPVWAVVVGFLGYGPLIRFFQKRKLEGKRERVLTLYEEIGRRLGSGQGEPERG